MKHNRMGQVDDKRNWDCRNENDSLPVGVQRDNKYSSFEEKCISGPAPHIAEERGPGGKQRQGGATHTREKNDAMLCGARCVVWTVDIGSAFRSFRSRDSGKGWRRW